MNKNFKKFKFINNQGVAYEAYFGTPWEFARVGKKKKARERMDGYCNTPEVKNPKILIHKDLKNKRKLNVIIEEFTHSFFSDLKEKEVRPFATTLTKFLYKNGWRKIK